MMQMITVAAAIILNEAGQLLLVRKNNTQCFMQVGGKLEPDETHSAAMLREIQEEIGCQARILQHIGKFETATANEPECLLTSFVFLVELDREPEIASEIAEMCWLDLDDTQMRIAPLTSEVVIPWCREFLAGTQTVS